MSILSVLPLMRRVTRAECLDPKALRRLRQQRFRRLLKHVFAKSRFYGRYYRAHGIAADQLDDIELRDLPTVNKQIVMDNFDALVCDPALTRAGIERFFHDHPDPGVRYRGRYYVMHTSGSTGSFGIFAYGPRD